MKRVKKEEDALVKTNRTFRMSETAGGKRMREVGTEGHGRIFVPYICVQFGEISSCLNLNVARFNFGRKLRTSSNESMQGVRQAYV